MPDDVDPDWLIYADMVSLEPSERSRQQALADIDRLISVLLQPT